MEGLPGKDVIFLAFLVVEFRDLNRNDIRLVTNGGVKIIRVDLPRQDASARTDRQPWRQRVAKELIRHRVGVVVRVVRDNRDRIGFARNGVGISNIFNNRREVFFILRVQER